MHGGGTAESLTALLPRISHATLGLHSEREIFDAAMSLVARSRARALLLTRPPDRPYMEATSHSMGGVISQTLHNLGGQQGGPSARSCR